MPAAADVSLVCCLLLSQLDSNRKEQFIGALLQAGFPSWPISSTLPK
jgi:hypothetical protein